MRHGHVECTSAKFRRMMLAHLSSQLTLVDSSKMGMRLGEGSVSKVQGVPEGRCDKWSHVSMCPKPSYVMWCQGQRSVCSLLLFEKPVHFVMLQGP